MTTEEPPKPSGQSPDATRFDEDDCILIDLCIPLGVVKRAIEALSEESTKLHWVASEMSDTTESAKWRGKANDRDADKALLKAAMQRSVRGSEVHLMPPTPSQRQSGAGVQSVITTNHHPEPLPQKAMPWLMCTLGFSVAAFVCALFTVLWVSNSERRMQDENAQKETRLRSEFDITRRYVEELRIRVVDNDILLQLAGIKKPGDAVTGPNANPKRLKPKE